jgi:hypothetical protein
MSLRPTLSPSACVYPFHKFGSYLELIYCFTVGSSLLVSFRTGPILQLNGAVHIEATRSMRPLHYDNQVWIAWNLKKNVYGGLNLFRSLPIGPAVSAHRKFSSFEPRAWHYKSTKLLLTSTYAMYQLRCSCSQVVLWIQYAHMPRDICVPSPLKVPPWQQPPLTQCTWLYLADFLCLLLPDRETDRQTIAEVVTVLRVSISVEFNRPTLTTLIIVHYNVACWYQQANTNNTDISALSYGVLSSTSQH